LESPKQRMVFMEACGGRKKDGPRAARLLG